MPSLLRPPFHRPTSNKFCMFGRIPDVFLDFKFHQDRLKNVGAVGGQIFGFPIDLAHRLYDSSRYPLGGLD